MVSKGAKEVVPISMIQGRKRNSINGELVIDPTDPSYREEVSPTTPADIYNHHNTVTVDPNQKQKDTSNRSSCNRQSISLEGSYWYR